MSHTRLLQRSLTPAALTGQNSGVAERFVDVFSEPGVNQPFRSGTFPGVAKRPGALLIPLG